MRQVREVDGPSRPIGRRDHLGDRPEAGNVLFARDDGHSIYRFVAQTGTISRFAGVSGAVEFGGDGGPALSAALRVKGIACDRAGNVFVAGQNRIRRIVCQADRSRMIETYAAA